jgi:hypothetical protein
LAEEKGKERLSVREGLPVRGKPRGRRGSNGREVRERGTEEKIANTTKYARQQA